MLSIQFNLQLYLDKLVNKNMQILITATKKWELMHFLIKNNILNYDYKKEIIKYLKYNNFKREQM
jgi:hypothetical protein